jgi:capsid portal protein
MDQHQARPPLISMAKLNNVREAMSTLEGTENIHTLIIGQDLTGFSAFH